MPKHWIAIWAIVGLFWGPSLQAKNLPVCAYIASYKQDYAWQRELLDGLKSTVDNRCYLQSFFMGSKSISNSAEMQRIAEQAKTFIETLTPQVVLFSDDNAVKYVLKPYFNQGQFSTVFSGVNDSAATYALDYRYTTGMVEKMPAKALFDLMRSILPNLKAPKVAFLTVDETSNNKDLPDLERTARQYGLELSVHLAKDFAHWKTLYRDLQKSINADILLLGNTKKIKDWKQQQAIDWSLQWLHKPTVSYLSNMKPISLFTVEKSAAEHGRWLGMSALTVIDGLPVSQIPVVPSHEVYYWMSLAHKKKSPKLILPRKLIQNLNIYRGDL